jgi:hypothetical protein
MTKSSPTGLKLWEKAFLNFLSGVFWQGDVLFRALPGSQETPVYICHVLRPRSDFHARPIRRFCAALANVTTKAPTISVIS